MRVRARRAPVGLVTLLIVAGCGASRSDIPAADPSAPLRVSDDTPVPRLLALSRTAIAAGDTVSLVGDGFIGPTRGTVSVSFDGKFTSDAGVSAAVHATFDGRFVQANQVTFVFEADAPPSSFGDTAGTFDGTVTATNVTPTGNTTSAPLTVVVTSAPSIVIRSLAPQGTTCAQKRPTNTLSGTVLELELAVTGLGSGSAYDPIALSAAWVDADGTAASAQAFITSGTTTTLTVDPGIVPTPPDVSSDQVPQQAGSEVMISLTAATSAKTIMRGYAITLLQPVTVTYDGNSAIVEVFAPEAVSGCLPGGLIGNEFDYEEEESEEAERAYELDTDETVALWIIDAGFGFKLEDKARSKSSSALQISHAVFPHWFGAFYRQRSQLLKVGLIFANDACGERTTAGSVNVTDWVWAPGFNQENSDCPPLPPPLLAPSGVVDVSQ